MNQYAINFNTVYNTLYGEGNKASFILLADKVTEENNVTKFYANSKLVGHFPNSQLDNFYKMDMPPIEVNDKLFDELLNNWNALVFQGGVVVDKLIAKYVDGEQSITNDLILTLLLSIGRYTETFKESKPICPYCFLRFQTIKKQGINFFVCPNCTQSANRIEHIDKIYLAINRAMETHKLINKSILYVNWLFYKEPIDFNAVYIAKHEDIDVEKLVVNIAERTKNTKQIPCFIEGKMSDNSKRILDKYFNVQ